MGAGVLRDALRLARVAAVQNDAGGDAAVPGRELSPIEKTRFSLMVMAARQRFGLLLEDVAAPPAPHVFPP
eukprot:8517430-Heterocapsa_arctica.AAC.1